MLLVLKYQLFYLQMIHIIEIHITFMTQLNTQQLVLL